MAEVSYIYCDRFLILLQEQTDETLVIDCRPFLAYNSGHIVGAHNIHCPPIVKRRFAGTMTLPIDNVLRSSEAREALKNGQYQTIVVYDENTNDFGELSNDSNMFLVLETLKLLSSSSVYILKGGYDDFQRCFPMLCESHASTESDSSESVCHSVWFTPSSTLPTAHSFPNLRTPDLRDTIKYKPSEDQGDPEAILPWLYLGSAYHAMQETKLRKTGINALINMASESDTLTPDPSFQYMRVAVDDSCTSDISSWFPGAIDFIESVRKQGGKVLVHCQAGISRSATVCIAYIMWFKGWTMEQAYDFLKSKRSLIAPNLNFMRQLVEFENQLEHSGRCSKSASTSTRSSSGSYISLSSCDCDSYASQSSNGETSCGYCQDKAKTDISSVPVTKTGFFYRANILNKNLPQLSAIYQSDLDVQFKRESPRSASAHLYPSNSRCESEPPNIGSPRALSAKPAFNLPPCNKLANVFSFDTPACAPHTSNTNSPTLVVCHSPLVSPS